ncbi:hypothetical protein HKD37_16G044912 [Glycine soja]
MDRLTNLSHVAFNSLNSFSRHSPLFQPTIELSPCQYHTSHLRKSTTHKKSKPSQDSCFTSEKSTMSSQLQMVPLSKLRYQRLRHEKGWDDERERRSRSWFRFRRVPIRRRFRLKIPSLRRLWRKRARLVSSMRISYAKVMKRFKEGQVHFGDLFAGNYLFMHVNPTSLKCLERDLY